MHAKNFSPDKSRRCVSKFTIEKSLNVVASMMKENRWREKWKPQKLIIQVSIFSRSNQHLSVKTYKWWDWKRGEQFFQRFYAASLALVTRVACDNFFPHQFTSVRFSCHQKVVHVRRWLCIDAKWSVNVVGGIQEYFSIFSNIDCWHTNDVLESRKIE